MSNDSNGRPDRPRSRFQGSETNQGCAILYRQSFFLVHTEVERCVMPCLLCASDNQEEFGTEINIHFRGLKNIDDPGVLFFPKVLVCLDCGASRFSTPADELLRLAGCVATRKAAAREGDITGSVLRRRITFGA
jgi:hypothetical protein